jgi:hypothetical protein
MRFGGFGSHCHVGTIACAPQSDFAADAAARSGDKDGLAPQACHQEALF